MGASAARKEARKRKFGYLRTKDFVMPKDAAGGSEEKAVEAGQGSPQVEPIACSAHQSCDTKEKRRKGEPSRKKSKNPGKGSQRFIVFIGEYVIFPCFSLVWFAFPGRRSSHHRQSPFLDKR